MNEELKVIISAETDKLKQNISRAKKEVANFSDKVKQASKDVDGKFAAMGDSIKNAMKIGVVAMAGAATAILALGASTAEYRKEQAKLTTAFEVAGGSATEAKETYNDLFRVLGDSGQATEAASHLAKLTTNEKELAEYTKICQGVYATFGDSLPIESLTEAINHTAKVGEVQGSLADALEWSGVNMDEFNEQLFWCNSESERERLIRDTLNGIYSDAATKYEENNAQLLAQNEAQTKMNDAMAELGEAVQPILTMLTALGADVLAQLTPYIQEFADKYLPTIRDALGEVGEKLKDTFTWASEHKTLLGVLAGIISGIVVAIGLYNAVAAVKAAMAALEVTTVWGLVAAYAAQAAAMVVALAPYLLIVAAVAAVVAAFVLLWKKCDWFREFWQKLWAGLKDLFAQFVESLKPLWAAIAGAFQEAWELIKVVWDLVKPYFQGIWNTIKIIFGTVKDVLGGYFKAAWENIKIVWGVVVSYFTTVWNNIKLIFSVVKNVLTGNFKGAWDGIKQIFSNWGIFFKGLWDSIKKIFSNVGQAIGNAISKTVKGAVNAVLSTATNIINGFIRAINIAISVINAIPGVNIKKLNTLDVPKMAKGGIVNSATLAVVGEQGKEAVMPLENNTEWIDMLANKLAARQGAGAPIVLQVDGKTFAQTVINAVNNNTKQTGRLGINMV